MLTCGAKCRIVTIQQTHSPQKVTFRVTDRLYGTASNQVLNFGHGANIKMNTTTSKERHQGDADMWSK